MLKLVSVVGCLALVAFDASVLSSANAPSPALPFPQGGPVCVQDQYGNQYNFTIDRTHAYLYGTATNAQGCDAAPWPLIGSYVDSPAGLVVELTASRPLDSLPCVATYKLKGIWPKFPWYYESGYGAQEATFVSCGTRVTADPTAGGTLGP
jgi:hypothetical protein